MPMVRRVPKRGFNNRFAKTVVVVNVGQINDAFDEGTEVTIDMLVAKNIAKGHFDELKILGEGELTKKLKINAHRFSKTAADKIGKGGWRNGRGSWPYASGRKETSEASRVWLKASQSYSCTSSRS